MNKKGFTLVELLAVITILGVIAVTIIPKIQYVIEDSRIDNYRNSVSGLLRAIETDHTESGLQNRVYTITNGKVSPDVDYKGSFNGSGTITYDDEERVTVKVYNNKYCATKAPDKKRITVIKGSCN